MTEKHIYKRAGGLTIETNGFKLMSGPEIVAEAVKAMGAEQVEGRAGQWKLADGEELSSAQLVERWLLQPGGGDD